MMAQRNLRSLLVAGAALIAMVSLAAGIRNAWQQPNDFRLRYHTARLMLAGENPYRLHLAGELTPRAREVLGRNTDALAPDYVPSAMLVMLPLALLPWTGAKLVWLCLNLAAAAGLVSLLRRWPAASSLPRSAFLAAVCLWIAGTPYRNDLGLGQNCVYSLSLTLAALWCQQRNRVVIAGTLLALGLFKYYYVAPLVLFCFVLNRGWKTLLVAGLIHGAAHLLICWHIHAHPLGVFADVWQDNTRVFNRNAMLTAWLPFRTLADWFPQAPIPATLLGALTLATILGSLILFWRRQPRLTDYPAWIFLLGLLSTLAVTAKNCHLAYFLCGWLWCFTLKDTPATHLPRRLILAGLVYLTLIHRLLEALGAGSSEELKLWLPRGFNFALFALCAASLVLFWRTMGRTPAGGDAAAMPTPAPPSRC